MREKTVTLAVDDSADDLALIRMAFTRTGVCSHLITLDDGEEALSYLKGKGHYADRRLHPFPRLLILDLNMPRVSGFEVLARLKAMDLNPRPYIAIMSTSRQPEEIKRCYDLGADLYATKPADFTDFCQVIQRITEFFSLASLQPASPVLSSTNAVLQQNRLSGESKQAFNGWI